MWAPCGVQTRSSGRRLLGSQTSTVALDALLSRFEWPPWTKTGPCPGGLLHCLPLGAVEIVSPAPKGTSGSAAPGGLCCKGRQGRFGADGSGLRPSSPGSGSSPPRLLPIHRLRCLAVVLLPPRPPCVCLHPHSPSLFLRSPSLVESCACPPPQSPFSWNLHQHHTDRCPSSSRPNRDRVSPSSTVALAGYVFLFNRLLTFCFLLYYPS